MRFAYTVFCSSSKECNYWQTNLVIATKRSPFLLELMEPGPTREANIPRRHNFAPLFCSSLSHRLIIRVHAINKILGIESRHGKQINDSASHCRTDAKSNSLGVDVKGTAFNKTIKNSVTASTDMELTESCRKRNVLPQPRSWQHAGLDKNLQMLVLRSASARRGSNKRQVLNQPRFIGTTNRL